MVRTVAAMAGETSHDLGQSGEGAVRGVLYFLKERTKFIRRFYEGAGELFRATIRQIEAKEPPFDEPPYSEDGEPPFMEEWTDATMALEMLGRTCI